MGQRCLGVKDEAFCNGSGEHSPRKDYCPVWFLMDGVTAVDAGLRGILPINWQCLMVSVRPAKGIVFNGRKSHSVRVNPDSRKRDDEFSPHLAEFPEFY
ncbi:hypothetical protein [Parablautia muri]|nr:hypothetical protein [Parablautia muri]